MRIGIDIMGGDFYPKVPVEGALLAQQAMPGVRFVLVGQQPVVEAELHEHGASAASFQIVHAEHVVSMHDHAATALRTHPNSSIVVGIKLLKDGFIDAFISSGNTGAVMAAAVVGLGLLEGIMRPTVGSLLPVGNGRYGFLCDVGANIDCKPEQLAQFGQIGAVYAESVMGIAGPKVALVNIGEEETKGTANVQAAHQLLKSDAKLDFIGNAEGRDLFSGKADVYVADGFVGNVLLKYGESFYDILKAKCPTDPTIEDYNQETVGGLPFLGVKGNVLIAHGIAGAVAFRNMAQRAVEVVESDLLGKLSNRFSVLQ